MDEPNIDRSIGRLEGKVDLVIDQMTQLRGAFSTLEAGRLSRLESQVASLVVKVGLISSGLAVAISVAAKLLFN